MSEQSSNCSEDRLRSLLQSDDDFGDDSQLAARHIAECQRCQSRLEELAAEPDEWSEARESLLSGDDRDEGRRAPMSGRPWARRRWQHRTTAWTESMSRQLLSPPSHPEMLGRIGRYEVERLIGAGGMGVVFKAFDTELNRPVAVKVLAPILAGSGAARQRFAREARAAAAVVHEHVVSIHNVETEGESPFLVMQYVAGESLQGRIDHEGALDVCEILRIGMQTAAGLAAAHAQGLVHRDVKPSNILLEKGVERALLTDFGLARASDDASLTHTGYHPGTPQYMSPEQARGDAVDSRSDLFSLGSVIYTMCTGRAPFRAETSYGILRRITDTEPRSIREINPNIPDWLESIVAKLMAKQADDRFESADEVAELLEDCLAHVQQPTAVPLPESLGEMVLEGNGIRSGWAQALRSVAPDGMRRPANSRRPPIGKLVAAAAFAFSLIFAGIMIVLELNKGTLTIECEIDNIPIRIMQGDAVVEQMTVTQAGTRTRIAAGKYVVEVENANDGFVVEGGTVSLMRGETRTVKIARNVRTGGGSSVRMPNEAIGSELDADFARRTTTINPDVPAQGKPVDKDKLLNELRERDRKFSRRSVELERNWNQAVSPRGMASEVQFQSMKYGQADPGIPQGLPEDYQQPHRIRYIWTGQNFESTLEILADLETAIHPEHGKLTSRTIESDCFNYQRFWDRDQKIFSHNSDIEKLCSGKKAWEYLLPSGFGFTPSILKASNAVEVDGGYILKGLISLPSATIGNRKNCFELHLDKDLILRRAVIQYHVYDFVIVTSGRSEFAGMPPLAKHAAVSIHHIGQDEKRSGDVGNYKYEVISLSERLSEDEYDLRVNFAIPKGTKLATGLNVVEVNLQGLPGVTQIERDQSALRPEMTPREDAGFPSDAVLQEMHDLLSEETRLKLDLRYVQQFLEGGKLFAKTDAAKTLENASRKEQIEARQQEITNRLKVIDESELGDLRRVAENAGLECAEEPLYGQSSYGVIVYAKTLDRIQKDELLLFHAGSLYRTRGTIRPLRTTGNGFFLRPNVAIPSGRHIALSCIQDAEEERENVKNGFMPDSNRARNPSRAYRANVYDRRSGKLIQTEQAAANGPRAELAEIEEAWTQRSKDVATTPTLAEATAQFNQQSAEDRRTLFDPPIPDLTEAQLREGFRKAAANHQNDGEADIAATLAKIVRTGRMPEGVGSNLVASGVVTKNANGEIETQQIAPALIVKRNDSSHRLVLLRSLELIYRNAGASSKRYGDTAGSNRNEDSGIYSQSGEGEVMSRFTRDANTTTETEVGQGQLIGILQSPFIQKKLRLSDEQIAKLSEINLIPYAVSFADAIAPLKTILTDDQLKEFKRNAFPGLMVRAFTISEVRESLELTQEQVTSIAAIQAKLKTLMQSFQDEIDQFGSPKNDAEQMQLERDTAQVHEDAYVEALELLTVEQRKKWEEIAKPLPLRKKNSGNQR